MTTRRSALRSAGRMMSQPMLVIPQPILRSHECLDENVRMARVESNAYVALGIKEEPLDEDDGFYVHYNHMEEDEMAYGSGRSSPQNQQADQEGYGNEEEEADPPMRTTRALQRKRLLGLQDDANNNSRNQPRKKRASRAKKVPAEPMEVPPSSEFNPIVVSTYSMAPNAGGLGEDLMGNKEYASLQPVPVAIPEPESNNNNNSEYDKDADYEVPVAGQDKEEAESSSCTDSKLDDYQPSKEGEEASSNGDDEHETFSTPLPEPDEQVTENRRATLRVRPSLQMKGSDHESEEEDEEEEDEDGAEEDEDDEDELFDGSMEDQKEVESSSSSEEEELKEDTSPKLWSLTEEERQTLTCSVCKKKCSRVPILTAHKKTHFDSNVYNCDHCNKTFSSESSYKHHVAYSGLAPHKCDQCGKSYFREEKAVAHRATCTGKNKERKYHCEECDRSYVMLCSLRTHIRERHTDFKPVKNLCCELCGKRFRHKKYLELHMYSHSSEKKFECDVCHRKYKSSDILRHHVRMVHKNLPRVVCTICNKEVSRVSLKAHVNRHREKQEEEEASARHLASLSEKADTSAPYCRICTSYFENDKMLEMHSCPGLDGSYRCPHCSDNKTAAFTTATELVNHTCAGLDNSKSRNSAKIYTCVFCCRQYNCHTPWLYHVRHHTNDKPYPCTECDKSFRLKQGLKVHMRNHTGEKPFKCDQCPAAFKQKPFLLDHMNTHTGNKPYQCKICQARFSVRSALSTHKRIHRREAKRNEEAASA